MRHEELAHQERIAEFAARLRESDPAMAGWAAGYGEIEHRAETQLRVHRMATELAARGVKGDGVALYELLAAADRIASAAMWLVVHQTYARQVYLDGRDLTFSDFKVEPEGHTGGSLNMVPAYVGYMAINALTGITRGWLMGQGHAVSAINSVNLLLGNTSAIYRERYPLNDHGLTRFVRDFYSYRLDERGEEESPLGSHVNPQTAGGLLEGGYLGFAELQYVHMPLPGERLVAFLSDGAFEEQRGSEWAPRWWRADDCGLVTPIMINNGRRIDQRTTMSQEGGVEWFRRHLELNSFDPIVIDGRDPAAFAWLIFEMESRLLAEARTVACKAAEYPVRMPYGIAAAKKGAGFYNAGTNLAHNLPLGTNPQRDPMAARLFNESARRLWVEPNELHRALELLRHHASSKRLAEMENPFVRRDVRLTQEPGPRLIAVAGRTPGGWSCASPMKAIDEEFLALVRANPGLRPRVGNPDEMKSNRMTATLAALKFRVTAPEPEVPESVHGAIITALNEEAVAAAALGNKGGINIVVTYEAFAPKMLGAVRQELTFSDRCTALDRAPGWLSVPLVLTSHTWENGKNELSHQDPAMAEALMGEMAHVSRVVFPADFNSAAFALHAVYRTRGMIWTMVVPKREVPVLFAPQECAQLLSDGAIELEWAGCREESPRVILVACGAYQLVEVLKASARLAERSFGHRVIYVMEPGRFRSPRVPAERNHLASEEVRLRLFPHEQTARVFVCHTRPEAMLAAMRPLDSGVGRTVALGFINCGGTLDSNGMLFVNRSTWAHCLQAVATVLGIDREAVLKSEEIAAIDHRRSPDGVLFPSRGAGVGAEGDGAVARPSERDSLWTNP